MSALNLHTIARRLGGEITAGKVIAPAPGHGPKDRSLWVIPSWQAPDGFRVHCFSPKDDWREARDYVRGRLGLGSDAWRRWEKSRQIDEPTSRRQLALCDAAVDFAVASDHATRIARAIAIWHASGDAHGSIVEMYLASRGLELPPGADALRYHPRCPWRDENRGETIFVPAMIALMRDVATDEPQAIQRTRLTPEGVKVARRMLGPAGGAAIKLDADDAVTMGLAIGEGTETVLAARQLGFRPAWALGSAGAIAAFPLLPGIEALTILSENDDANARAVEECARRWHEAGHEVIVVEPKSGNDINDAIRGAA